MQTHWKTNLARPRVVFVAMAIAGCGTDSADDRARQTSPETFTEPPVVASSAGVLRVSLTPAPSTVTVAGHRVMLMAYNGLYDYPWEGIRLLQH